MSVEVVTRTIQFILAPVVMVSTCAIMLGSLLGRYAFINDRLRGLAQERLTLLRSGAGGSSAPTPEADPAMRMQRLQEIEAQMPNLIRRHALLRNCVLALNAATLVFFIDMFVIALAALANEATWAATLALLIFLGATTMAAFGVVLSTLEIRTSHLAVEHDLAWVVGSRVLL